MYRFYLAESSNMTKEYEGVGEILKYLYCKCVFEADSEFLAYFEDNNGVCLREAVYDILTRVTAHLLEIANGIKEKGDAFAAAGKHTGNCYYNMLYTSPIYLCHIALCNMFVYRGL